MELVFLTIGFVAGLFSGHYFFVKKNYRITKGDGDGRRSEDNNRHKDS